MMFRSYSNTSRYFLRDVYVLFVIKTIIGDTSTIIISTIIIVLVLIA